MAERSSHGKMTGVVVQQRSGLRRNLVHRLFRLGNAVQTQTQQLLALTSDISVVHYRILLRLSQAGPQNVQGIAELLGTNRSLVSRVLPALRTRGWVELLAHESDRRQLIVHLTDDGRAVVKQHEAPIMARFDALQAAFTDDELDSLLEYLDRLESVTHIDAAVFDAERLAEDHSVFDQQETTE